MLNSMNMTGTPSQENRPSVFGQDATFASTINWRSGIPCPQYCGLAGPSTSFSSPMQGPSSYFYTNYNAIPSTVNFPITRQSLEVYNPPVVETALRQCGCKRKMEEDMPLPNPKQYITEDRMAEHLSKLHISTQRPAPSSEPEATDVTEKRLYLCEEMKKLQDESILPEILLQRARAPCQALVLWTPPQRPFVPLQLNDEDINNNDNSNNADNNNFENMPDNNLMDLDR